MDELRAATRDFLRRALEAKGWTPYRLAKEAGVSATTITRPLNDENYTFVPKLDTLAKIAKAAGIELPETITATKPLDISPIERSIPVIGEVRAGYWSFIPDDPQVEGWLPVQVPDYAGARLFALKVSGRSMDLLYPDGSFVILAEPAEAGVRVGDRVVVRRFDAAGKAETTLKEIVRLDSGELVLQPRSSDATIEAIPLPINDDDQAQDGPEIIGVVIGTHGVEKRGTGPLLRL